MRTHSRAFILACLLFYAPLAAIASESEDAAKEAPVAVSTPVAPAPPDDYCANISDFAKDARYVLQMKTLTDLQSQIDKKITKLEAVKGENAALLKKRDEESRKTEQSLVDIFAKMKPDVAAAQFEILDVETSASILKRLNARAASTILNEMKAPIAAAITIKMAEPISELKTGNGT